MRVLSSPVADRRFGYLTPVHKYVEAPSRNQNFPVTDILQQKYSPQSRERKGASRMPLSQQSHMLLFPRQPPLTLERPSSTQARKEQTIVNQSRHRKPYFQPRPLKSYPNQRRPSPQSSWSLPFPHPRHCVMPRTTTLRRKKHSLSVRTRKLWREFWLKTRLVSPPILGPS